MIRLFGFFLILSCAAANAASLRDFHGTYLGYATVEDADGTSLIEREMTVSIDAYKRNGLRIRWISVDLVDGRRDHPDVKYRTNELLLQPSDNDRYFVATIPHSPFDERKDGKEPLSGDPLRWAVLDGESLKVYSFVILSDGRFELQRYDRELVDGGLAIGFERNMDGTVDRRVTGFARKFGLSGQ